MINERLAELGITLPSVAPPNGNYVGARGDAGRRTRTAVGIVDLPFAITVEIDMTSRIRD